MHVAITADLPFDVPSRCPNLAWVQAVGAGTTHLQTAGLRQRNIRLTNAAGSNAAAIAEFVLGRLLADAKRFRELESLQQRHDWDSRYGAQLAGTTLGLIGFGAINRAVARRASAMDMRVVATRRTVTNSSHPVGVDVMYPASELPTMLAECDAVVAAVPETPETNQLINRAAIASMKEGAFFINVGRGSLVDEDALIEALESGRLRGAALDVVSTEPLPHDSRLWDVPNLYLSPHCASAPTAHFRNLHELFRANLRRFLDGAPLQNEVDLTRGY